MRNYLHRLIERATGDRGAAPQRALGPQVGPRREADDEAPVEGSAIHEATRPGADRTAQSDTSFSPIAPRSDVRDPFVAPSLAKATPAPRVEPATPAQSPPRVEPAPEPRAPRSDDHERLAPMAPRADGLAARASAPLVPTAPRTEARDPLAARTPRAAATPAPAPLVPTPPAPERLAPPRAPIAPAPPAPSLEPRTPAPPATPAPRTPSTLQPHAAPERPPLRPPPILSVGRVVVEVMPAPPAPAAPAPIIVRRAAPAAAPAQSSILHRGFGLGQS